LSKRIPKRQHYVPKFYLKEFATHETYGKKDKAQVHTYDLKDKKKSIRNIKTIAYEKYLYSPENANNDRSIYMEDKLADLESMMSKIWNSFVNNRMSLSPQMKKGIALFIATLIFRHPDNLLKNENTTHFLYTEIMDNIPKGETKFTFLDNGKESIIDISEMEKAINSSDYDKSMYFIDNIDYFSLDIAELLVKKKWSIIVSNEKVFITSDRPVIISNAETGLLGIKSPGVIIGLPLSPTRILLLEDNHNDEDDLTEYPLNKGHESYYNQPIWSNAYRYIIGHKDLEEVINNIFEYNNTKKKP